MRREESSAQALVPLVDALGTGMLKRNQSMSVKQMPQEQAAGLIT